MPSFTYRHRVRYRECDPMGVVYHGHYLDYLEYARTEALRSAGLAYKDVEAGGVLMPVTAVRISYRHPARYDDVLEITTRIDDRPPAARMDFEYLVHIVEGGAVEAGHRPLLAATAEVTLCFLDAASGRPRRAPGSVLAAFDRMLSSHGEPAQ